MHLATEERDWTAAVRCCTALASLLLACGETPPVTETPSTGGSAGSNAGSAAQSGGSAGTKTSGGAGAASATGGMAANSSSSGGSLAAGGSTGGSLTNGGSSGGSFTNGGSSGGLRATGGSSGGSFTSGGSSGGSRATGGRSAAGGTVSSGGSGGASSGGPSGGGGAAAGASAILEPKSGILLGQYYGDGSISATGTKLGRTLPVHLTYYAWDDDWTSGNTKSDLNAGRIPLVNWELFDATLDDIIAGVYDTMLAQRAKDAKNLGKKFFLDFGAEMNGDWSPWSGAQNGSSAAKYLAAYRHTHDALVAGGATNAVWVWCPNVTDEPNQSWNRALEYYPGDAYVDWTCVDGYNWGSSNGGGWQSFHDVFANIYPKLAAKNKPILIGEMASAEVGGDKAAWITAMLPTLNSDFPLIKGLIWFDVNKETDWRISSSPAAEAAFVKMVSDPYCNP